MSFDEATLRFYETQSQAYATATKGAPAADMRRFLNGLPEGSRVLELGCGGGHDSLILLAAGMDVVPTDGSPAMAAEAEGRIGRTVEVLRINDLAFDEEFHGVFASACLLHLDRGPRNEALCAIGRALKPGGRLYASFKSAEAPWRDSLGRFYGPAEAGELRAALIDAGLGGEVLIDRRQGGGFGGEAIEWLHVHCRKRA